MGKKAKQKYQDFVEELKKEFPDEWPTLLRAVNGGSPRADALALDIIINVDSRD